MPSLGRTGRTLSPTSRNGGTRAEPQEALQMQHPQPSRQAQARLPRSLCGLQAVEYDGWCELRTRILALSLAKYRAGPPYQYSARKDPDVLNGKSITLAVWTSISDQFHLLLLNIPGVVAAQQDTYSHPSKRRLGIETARLRTGRAVGHTVRAWLDPTCCHGPQVRPRKG
jgi:hypothetical protein